MEFFIATWDGSRYEVSAVGATEAQALALVVRAAKKYQRKNGLQVETSAQIRENLTGVQRLVVGKAYLDGGRAGEV